MVLGKLKSRTFKQVKKKVPGGRTATHFVKRSPAKAKCNRCGAELKGVPRLRPYKMKKGTRSSKRPERPYGGVLCSSCTRKEFKEKSKQ